MKKIIIIISIIIFVVCFNKTNKKLIIPENSIRVRVIANSNNIEDQVLKIKVKQKLEDNLYKELSNVNNINEARIKIYKTMPKLKEEINKSTNNYTLTYGKNYFPKKEMFGIEYKEGIYESIVINLGEAKGNNWWCVLFPPICMIEAKKTDKDNVEYKSKVLEILNKYS